MAAGGDIRAGRAYVELAVKNSQFMKGLQQAQMKLRDFGKGMALVGKGMMAAGGAITAPFLLAAKQFASAGDQLDKMSKRTGVSVSALSELGYAAGQSGTDLETLENSIRKMQKGIADASQGSKEQIEAFERLGISLTALTAMAPDKQFELIADRISQVADPTMRAAAAMDVFGKSGTAMLPMLEEGAEGIRKMRDRKKELGGVFTAEEAAAAAKFTDAMDDVKHSLAGAFLQVGAAIIPILTQQAEKLKQVAISAGKWVKENQSLLVLIFKLGTALTVFGTIIYTFGKVYVAASMLASAIRSVGIAMTFLYTHPIFAALAVLAVAVAAVGAAYTISAMKTDMMTDAADKAVEAGDKLRESTISQLDRLEQLADKQRLTNTEMTEAKSLIAELAKTYGEMGLSVDETTGRLKGFTKAQKEANEAMKEKAIAEIQGRLREIAATQKQLLEGEKPSFGLFRKSQAAREASQKARAAFAAEEGALRERLKTLEAGKPGALTGAAKPAGAPGLLGAVIEDARAQAFEQEQADFRRRRELELSLIEDQQTADLERLADRYAFEREEIGANAMLLNELHLEEEAAVKRKYDLIRQEEMNRQREQAEERMAGIMAEVKAPDLQPLKTFVRGTFSASAVAGMGTGGVQERIAKGVEKLVAGDRKLEALAEQLLRRFALEAAA